MKKEALCLAALLALGGCQQAEEPQPETAATAQEASTGDVPPLPLGAARGRPLATPLPAGISLDFPYHVRQDITVPGNGGVARRKIGFEYLEGDGNSVHRQLDATFRHRGFRLLEERVSDSGNRRIKYHLNGFGTVIVNIPTEKRDSYRNPAANGHFSLDFPIKGE